jgi:hypothetical protein
MRKPLRPERKPMKPIRRPQALLAASLLATVGVQAQNTLTNGLIAYYPFNGNANDESGNGYGGAVQNATLSPDRFGQAEHAYVFNGSNAYIELPSGVRDQISGAAKLSISTWIRPTGTPSGGTAIFGQWVGVTAFLRPVGILLDRTAANDLSVSLTYGTSRSADANLQAGVWQSLVLTFDGTQSVPSDRLRLYLDGAELSLGAGTDSDTPHLIGSSASSSLLGATESAGGLAFFFDGSIDDVRIYNRTLSAGDITELYKLETSPGIEITRAVKLVQYGLAVGNGYQLQQSVNLTDWTDYGTPFTATATLSANYADVANWNTFWRLKQVSP